MPISIVASNRTPYWSMVSSRRGDSGSSPNLSTSFLGLILNAEGVFTVGKTASTIEAGMGVQARPNLTVLRFS